MKTSIAILIFILFSCTPKYYSAIVVKVREVNNQREYIYSGVYFWHKNFDSVYKVGDKIKLERKYFLIK